MCCNDRSGKSRITSSFTLDVFTCGLNLANGLRPYTYVNTYTRYIINLFCIS